MQEEKDKSVQVPADLHKRIAALRKVAKEKLNLDQGVNVNMSGVISIAVAKLEAEWGIDNASDKSNSN